MPWGLSLLGKLSDGRNDYDDWEKAEEWQKNGRKTSKHNKMKISREVKRLWTWDFWLYMNQQCWKENKQNRFIKLRKNSIVWMGIKRIFLKIVKNAKTSRQTPVKC